MSHYTCTKCRGFQVIDTHYDLQGISAVPQLRCLNCGKIEQLTWDGRQWTTFIPGQEVAR